MVPGHWSNKMGGTKVPRAGCNTLRGAREWTGLGSSREGGLSAASHAAFPAFAFFLTSPSLLTVTTVYLYDYPLNVGQEWLRIAWSWLNGIGDGGRLDDCFMHWLEILVSGVFTGCNR